MKTIGHILIVFIFFTSCTSRTIYKKPENLIPKEEMVQLWTDLLIANGAKTTKNKKAQGKVNYMPFIYKKYNIDSTRFMESNIYYTSKIEEYEKMFQEVEVNIQKIKEIYDPLSKDIDPELPVWKRDSIRSSRKLKKPKKVNEQLNREINLEEVKKEINKE